MTRLAKRYARRTRGATPEAAAPVWTGEGYGLLSVRVGGFRLMPGPPPKNPATRRRRNRVSTATTLAAAASVEPPVLPAEREWHVQTRCWWEDVWRSPMSAEFLEADAHGLFRLAVLIDDYWTADSPAQRCKLAAEIRLQGQGYGLSPLDRRRLQWQVEQVEGKRDARRRSARGKDPRLGLAR